MFLPRAILLWQIHLTPLPNAAPCLRPSPTTSWHTEPLRNPHQGQRPSAPRGQAVDITAPDRDAVTDFAHAPQEPSRHDPLCFGFHATRFSSGWGGGCWSWRRLAGSGGRILFSGSRSRRSCGSSGSRGTRFARSYVPARRRSFTSTRCSRGGKQDQTTDREFGRSQCSTCFHNQLFGLRQSSELYLAVAEPQPLSPHVVTQPEAERLRPLTLTRPQ